MRCTVCGLPLRPSKSSEATCGSLSCRRIHRLRAPWIYGRRCTYCAREAVPSEETCDSPRCRKLKEGRIDGWKRERERRAEIDRVALEREGELREAHGPGVPPRLIAARLPANEQTVTPLAEERRADFAVNVRAALDRALDDPDRPIPESPEAPASRAGLIGAACTACRGSCCRRGGEHAYLYPDHFRRYLRDHPGTDPKELLAAYESRLPAESYHDSCVYHTTTGCALPREMRSNLCNTFLCGGLTDLLEAQDQEPAPVPVLMLCFKEAAAPEFKTYARQVVANAKALAAELLARGYDLVTGGTDNHLLLVDLRRSELSGSEAEDALHKAGITVNKNAVPNDPRPPAVTSGIRIGTAAVTTRGLGEAEFRVLGGWIDDALKRRSDEAALAKIRKQVADLCSSYPIYQHRSE